MAYGVGWSVRLDVSPHCVRKWRDMEFGLSWDLLIFVNVILLHVVFFTGK